MQPTRLSGVHKWFVYFHASAISGYYFLVGYFITKLPEGRYDALFLFSVVMLMHFIVMDYGVRHRFRNYYGSWLRWLLAAATLAGLLIGFITKISYIALMLLNSLFAGVLLINLIQEELKHVSRQSMMYFILGALGYTLLLLAMESTLK